MKYFEIRPIIIPKSNISLVGLKEELGEGLDVPHQGEAGSRVAIIKIITVKGNKRFAVKSAVVDETQIGGAVTAQTLAQDIVDNHDVSTANRKRSKKERIEKAEEKMNSAIDKKAAQIFMSKHSRDWLVLERSWSLRFSRPNDYLSANLRVIHPSTNFMTPGELLNTVQKISSYYNELLSERVVPMDRFREARVQQYLNKKAAIEAE